MRHAGSRSAATGRGGNPVRRWHSIAPFGLALILASAAFVQGTPSPTTSAITPSIGFETPMIVDPIHTFGEPDIGVDPQGRVFSSGPTGTGTQRSVWFGSVDGGHTFRAISAGPPPDAIQSFNSPPGGGDTDIAFARNGTQFFT